MSTPSKSEPPLVVTHLDHTRERGGAEYALKRVLEAHTRTWDACLILPNDPDEGDLGVYASLPENGVRVGIIGESMPAGASSAGAAGVVTYAFGLVREAWALRRSSELRNADLIHANSTRAAAYAVLALFGRRTPFVIHLRDMVTKESLGNAGYLLMSKFALRRADGVIANSESTLESARPHLRARTASAVIASPIGPVTPSSEPQSSSLRIGMVARLDPWKGQRELIAAFAKGAPEDATLVLAGTAAFGHTDYLDELRGVVREIGIIDRVEFAGHVENVNDLLATFDICVHASTRPEPLGQNVLQYLASGRTTIAVNAGGPAEWIIDGTNGILTPLQDPEALARAINRLAGDPALRSRLAAAAARTPDLPTDASSAVKHADFFNTVARGRASE